MDLGQVFTRGQAAEYMVSLFGADKDARLLDACFGDGAFLEALRQRGYGDVTGYEIDKDICGRTAVRYPEYKLVQGDFLGIQERASYDGIIMNPPYIRQEKIDDLEPLGITKAILRKDPIYRHLPSTANMYMYFTIKAIELLKTGGELVIIFPSSWMQARSGQQFREALLSRCGMEKEIHIKGEVFEQEALVEVVILKLVKGICQKNTLVEYLEIKDGNFLPRKGFKEVLNLNFQMPFSDLAGVRRGLTTGYNAMYINPGFSGHDSERFVRPILSTPKAVAGYSTKGAKTDFLFFPGKEGEFPPEVALYLQKWKEKIIKEKSPKTLYERALEGERWYEIREIKGTGILFSYFVRNDMKFVLNDQGYFVRDNFYVIYPKMDKMLLFALLNNYYTYYQLEQSGKKYGAGLLKLQRYDIESLKFPDHRDFSKSFTKRLTSLAKELSVSGQGRLVREITEALSEYSSAGYEEIVRQYDAIKRHRLEGGKDGI